jgi:type VI secretion system protein ImpH
MLIEFLLRDPMPCDLELGLRPDETPSLILSQESPVQLGWTTFLGSPDVGHGSRIQLTVRTI